MKKLTSIPFFLTLILGLCTLTVAAQTSKGIEIDFCGQKLSLNGEALRSNTLQGKLSHDLIEGFYLNTVRNNYVQVVESLQAYRKHNSPDDWLFYQLIRRTAQQLSPKESNYYQYTVFKWHLLNASGYNALLRFSENKMLLYVQCDENIYNIPGVIKNEKQFVCLNYHDYGSIDFSTEHFDDLSVAPGNTERTFSYKVTHVPDYSAAEYLEKDIHFSFHENDYHFKVKLSPQTQKLFTNYPAVDYESFLNIPLSKETYNSLIPQLKKNLKGMRVRNGVDYLMRFTRYAFLFETDKENFGAEKRLSPEQTLFSEYSDCEDRVALFFYLVKEIYDLPMIVLTFPSHVTIAVEFEESKGQTIAYQGKSYTVCEPTPQKQDLLVGQLSPELSKTPYQVAYVYRPPAK